MESKERVGREAARYVEDGTTVGIGTGSTAAYFIDELGKRKAEEDLSLCLVSTSEASIQLAQSVGLVVADLDEVDHIDLTIDGVDEFTPDMDGIKGGGGALLQEKIVADKSDRVLWIAEEHKLVDQLGAFPLPVEVIKFGSSWLYRHFDQRGFKPSWRTNADGTRFLTDNNNYIIDLHLGLIKNPRQLAEDLIHTVGVVEHGLFLGRTDDVLIGSADTCYLLSQS